MRVHSLLSRIYKLFESIEVKWYNAPMSVEIQIPNFLHHLTGGVETFETEGITVGECLDALIQRFPPLKEQVFDEKGKLRELLNVYVNRESAYPEELEKPVKDGDSLQIAYTLVGG